jgi:hypothetical protein
MRHGGVADAAEDHRDHVDEEPPVFIKGHYRLSLQVMIPVALFAHDWSRSFTKTAQRTNAGEFATFIASSLFAQDRPGLIRIPL